MPSKYSPPPTPDVAVFRGRKQISFHESKSPVSSEVDSGLSPDADQEVGSEASGLAPAPPYNSRPGTRALPRGLPTPARGDGSCGSQPCSEHRGTPSLPPARPWLGLDSAPTWLMTPTRAPPTPSWRSPRLGSTPDLPHWCRWRPGRS